MTKGGFGLVDWGIFDFAFTLVRIAAVMPSSGECDIMSAVVTIRPHGPTTIACATHCSI
jgi:hypothetical protein